MIKLKPIAEQVLNEADETMTWGDVNQFLSAVKSAASKGSNLNNVKDLAIGMGKTAAKSWAKGMLNSLTGGVLQTVLDVAENHGEEIGSFLLNLGKEVSNSELKDPKKSEFKKMTGPFWEAVKLTPEVSMLLDDQIEKQFIDQVILPKLKTPGSESEPLPNMDELLGAWLNDMGLKDKADIHFTGKSGNL